jgi:hypothetical protein
MLPYIPFRAFSLKGAIWGTLSASVLCLLFKPSILGIIAAVTLSASIASFTTMNFTGSSTFTSLSGVKKEMKWSIPFQIALAVMGLIIFILSKFLQYV